jgi:hypothetical protein
MTEQVIKTEEVFYLFTWSSYMVPWDLECFYLTLVIHLTFNPFILISVITSAALIPILLTKRKAPTFKKISTMSLQEAIYSSPFGMVVHFFMELSNLHYLPYLQYTQQL